MSHVSKGGKRSHLRHGCVMKPCKGLVSAVVRAEVGSKGLKIQ